MDIDVGKLRKEIVEILKQPIKKTAKTTKTTPELQGIENAVRPIIEAEILRHDLLDRHDILGCNCLESKKLKADTGSGAFRTVFDRIRWNIKVETYSMRK
jgi:hypothetical protein